eukprot:CAMPEP_0197622074 /NCGR_PEP_ID=MMETSP1338-20131121/2474_1 /TAXON_ID=43686 ORGANISM="Pelagodinium beii, Strain RCC1491" /NCGR_SAMPLE_ID=MMETSP1338 /ASSEMBLY_ACC=CAM_ASM_000754 /LENGTH=381 /DNA_ID=CAMNT_0043191709 /DNA_START=43 /DNA_END=1188 /DNA_ORIENTATION=+
MTDSESSGQILLRQVKTSGSLILLLIGWLSPQYAAKLCDPALNTFLMESPMLAAAVVQACWAPLVFMARVPDGDRGALKLRSLPVLFACLVVCVHAAWYKSFSLTNVATNTVLWNTDTVTTLLIAFAFSRSAPTRKAVLGASLSLLGAALAVGFSVEGDTLGGCCLCFSASLGFALYAVLVERLWDASPVRLLALEGMIGLLAILVGGGITAVASPGALTTWFAYVPSPRWLVFMALNCLMLNLGWLWCTELVGATWTAMVACLSIPISTLLDSCLLGINPSPAGVCGGALIVIGFALTTWKEEPSGPEKIGRCKRWLGWDRARTTPFLEDGPSHTCDSSESTASGPSPSDLERESDCSESNADVANAADTVQSSLSAPPV